MALDIDAADLRLLAEIGFLGIGRGQAAKAVAIFDLLATLRPAGEAGHVGAAMAELAQGRPDRAEARLRAAPQTETVLALRANALRQAGDSRKAADLVADLGFMRAGGAALEIAQGTPPGDR